MKRIGTISTLNIQRQINKANLEMLQNYSKVLEEGDRYSIRQFIHSEISPLQWDSGRVDLVGEGFKVSACVKGLSLTYQDGVNNLQRVLEYGLRDSEGEEISCEVSSIGEGIDFYYENDDI